ncbi:MAG: hypothetical protein KDD55_00555 [Bdellovibrionales bacterium]|nr:hypothetical protein [Bdellovibrionales bacterium]
MAELIIQSHTFSTLDTLLVVGRLEQLARRIQERFPSSGLLTVCHQLCYLGRETDERRKHIGNPILSLRITSWLLIGVILLGLLTTLFSLTTPDKHYSFIEFVQLLESGINDVVLIGAAIFFLYSLEGRLRRKKILKWLHEFRSIAHVIDMHQLTKDPERALSRGNRTASSPENTLTLFELSRYLDYCSEMLSLTGKLSAVYAQEFDDPLVLASVNEIEGLTTGLSRKIWQKLMIVHSYGRQESLLVS